VGGEKFGGEFQKGSLISQKVFKKSFFKSRSPQKIVKLFSTSVMIKDKLTDLWGN
jgi:hypothetical protein